MIVNVIDGRREKNFDDSTKVLIDIFRATTTIPLMLYRNAKSIIPVRTITETRKMKAKNPDYLTSGERYGVRIPRFNYGNSPSVIMGEDLSGKTLLFTSTNGIKVLFKIREFPGDIYLSSFINFTATYNAIKDREKVSIIVSNRPDGISDEDYIYANMLKAKLEGEEVNVDDYCNQIRASHGAKRLKIMGAAADIESSLKVDIYHEPIIYSNGKIIPLTKLSGKSPSASE
ncbi:MULTISPECIES: 2-phosphosulfolactate phosphatase [Ferroplasma]|uniref:2-phosphosulfolactate phosphatase n=2 Tax=Ferroplasma TaxID=74968 RepID=S0AN56_FERAC|nr:MULTISPECIES: 2-phosphosulfolactate phosphatase [Ferroplasma]AGO60703.1 2-phosphosulfolactate phosphatase [Ferroplasma acidarmanus Fer1]ARD85465.1 2-phosphosulfolactate phosphatase [Ferroplasma acidiphilum]